MSDSPRTPKASPFASRSNLVGCLLVPLAYIVLPCAAWLWTYRAMERIVLTILYGDGRYAAGLRIVNRSLLLSDGTTLPSKYHIVLGLPAFLMTVAVVALGHLLVTRASGDVDAMTEKR